MARVGLEGNAATDLPVRGTPCRLSILGATGSIGTSTLDLVGRHQDSYEIVALTAQSKPEELAQLAVRHRARLAVIGDEKHYGALKAALGASGIKAAAGADALCEAASAPSDCVMAAIVGAAGLKPTFAALERGRRIALANKECLVSAGSVFTSAVARTGAELVPVDSEHSAAFQLLAGAEPGSIEKIVLTASGGPFRSWSLEQLEQATPEKALKHPNWSMGDKITIDSATLMNKGLELIEAYHLFPVDHTAISAVIHPQSIVHCLVMYKDGSVLAQMAPPDMRTPIAVALAWPARMSAPTERLDLVRLGTLTFEAPDEARFPALRLAREAMQRGDTAPAFLNAANEEAVAAFLARKIGFCGITRTVEAVLETASRDGSIAPASSLDDVLAADALARRLAQAHITRYQ